MAVCFVIRHNSLIEFGDRTVQKGHTADWQLFSVFETSWIHIHIYVVIITPVSVIF